MREYHMLDIIEDEIRTNFPPLGREIQNDIYNIHCSEFISEQIYKSFLEKGFFIPTDLDSGCISKGVEDEFLSFFKKNESRKSKIISYQTPVVGRMNVYADLASGYTIEKDNIKTNKDEETNFFYTSTLCTSC